MICLPTYSKYLLKIKTIVFSVIVQFLISTSASAQDVQILGQVADDEGLFLPGVTVQIKGTTRGLITDVNGNFELRADNGDILVFSYVGFLSQEIEVSSQTTLNIKLQSDVAQLDEVVVVGYGTQRKSDITGSTGLLTSKDVDLQPVQRVENMLQGKVAGVTVIQNSGAPGAQPKVNIRGFNGNPTYVIDGQIDADINSINPNDIETISVLKDASATAIYGSRGANGVILVTTKGGGKNQKLSVDLEYFHSIASLTNTLDLLDPVEYMLVENLKDQEAGLAEGQFSRAELIEAESDPNFGTDWQDFVFRLAHTDNMNLSISKGWERLSLRASVGLRNEDGIVDRSNYKRSTLGINLSYDLTKKTTIRVNSRYAREQTQNVGNRGSGDSRIIRAATVWSPNLPIIDPLTGDYTINPSGYGPLVLENPGYLVNEVQGEATRNIYNTVFSIKQQLLRDLSLMGTASLEYRSIPAQTFRRQEPGVDTTTVTPTQILSSEREELRQQYNVQLDYARQINKDHRIDITMVGEVLYREQETFRFRNQYTFDETFIGIPGVTLPDSANNPYDFSSLGQISYLARVNYDFKNKLLFTGSFRQDASSRLESENQWDSFFSAALAYRLADEAFLAQSRVIHDLKLRVGYGEVGNVNSIGFAQIQNTVDTDLTGYVFSENELTNAVKFEDGGGQRANPDLRWETSRTYNAGLDLTLWKGKVEMVLDYYVKYTEDAQFNRRYPNFLGGGSARENVGRFRNNGIETTLIHQLNTGSNLQIRNSLNFAYNRAKVLEIPGDSLPIGNIENSFDQRSHVLIEGQPFGTLWGYQYDGIGEDGQAIYRDINGDGNRSIEDMTVLGNGHPDFSWGWNTHIDYKNFSLNLFIQGVHGADVFNLPKHALLGGGGGVLSATSREIYNSASYGGPLPNLTEANLEVQSSLFVEDASFVRLRNITLGYNVPAKQLERLSLQSLRFYIGAQNLLTLTDYSGYDPETRAPGFFTTPGVDRGSFPVPRVFTAGLNLNF
ncbi:MAG: TonB-dependent receptor [Bacteroidota bacterium]